MINSVGPGGKSSGRASSSRGWGRRLLLAGEVGLSAQPAESTGSAKGAEHLVQGGGGLLLQLPGEPHGTLRGGLACPPSPLGEEG